MAETPEVERGIARAEDRLNRVKLPNVKKVDRVCKKLVSAASK
jgi:hypothetical protein